MLFETVDKEIGPNNYYIMLCASGRTGDSLSELLAHIRLTISWDGDLSTNWVLIYHG